MKSTLFTLVILLLAMVYSFSQSSTVTIFTQDGEKIWVVVDGEKKNKDPQTKVIIDNLKAQNYKFKVIFQDSNLPSLDKTIYTKDVDNNYHNSTYVVRKDTKGSKYVIRVNSDEVVTTTTTTTTTTTAPSNTNTSTTTTVNSQPTGNETNTQTYQQNITTTTNSPDNINMNVGINVNETPDGVNMNVNMGGLNVNTTGTVTSSSTTTTTVTTTSSTNNVVSNPKPVTTTTIQSQPKEQPVKQNTYSMPGYSGPTGCPMPMSNESFVTAKNSISSKSFEDSKLTIAKQVVGNNCLICSQVKEIMKLFSFEDTKLEFAKFAYKHTFDIGNYYQLNDAFTFETSIDELNQYISNGGN